MKSSRCQPEAELRKLNAAPRIEHQHQIEERRYLYRVTVQQRLLHQMLGPLIQQDHDRADHQPGQPLSTWR